MIYNQGYETNYFKAKCETCKCKIYQLGALEPNSTDSRGHQHRTALAAQCQNKATQPILQGRIGNISCETVAWHASIAVQNACRIEEHCISTNNSHFVKRFLQFLRKCIIILRIFLNTIIYCGNQNYLPKSTYLKEINLMQHFHGNNFQIFTMLNSEQ